VDRSLRRRVQASMNCMHQRQCSGLAEGAKRTGECGFSSQDGSFDSTPGPASGAT
jgi:hypothetical protein